MQNPIQTSIRRVLNGYLDAKKIEFANHPLGKFVRRDIPQYFSKLTFLDSSRYVIRASVGQGNWTNVPWIAIMNKEITTTTQEGYYIVYLFSEDMKAVYLTLAQGVTKTSKEEMAKIKQEIRELIKQNDKIMKDDQIYLGESSTAINYAYSTAVYIKYSINNLPTEIEFQEDLKEMLDIYEEYFEMKSNNNQKGKSNKWFVDKIIEAFQNLGGSASLKEVYDYIEDNYRDELSIYKDWPARVRQQIYVHSSDADKVFEGIPGGEKDLFYSVKGKGRGVWGLRDYVKTENDSENINEEFKEYISYSSSEIVSHIHGYIKSKGFLYSIEEVTKLFLSIKTKPFVILSGISGTGKTMIVKWFAESIGATEENGQFKLIPVRPDWNDGSDLLGYVDIQGNFKEGPLTKVIRQAELEREKPFIVLLDEMNLARVEYYFSDILSVMESKKWDKNGKIISSKLLSEETAGFDLTLPNNLYIIGTVNMDETTYPFSKKVLDRANTIEFNKVDLENLDFLQDKVEKQPIHITNNDLRAEFLHLKDVYQDYQNIVESVTKELVKINKILETMYAHVGYRVRDEICFYLAYNEDGQLLEFSKAFDHCILQKILPRLSGSDSRIDRVLKELYLLFTNKVYDQSLNDFERDLDTAKYPQSAKKVLEMIRRLEEDGFTSFWIS